MGCGLGGVIGAGGAGGGGLRGNQLAKIVVDGGGTKWVEMGNGG